MEESFNIQSTSSKRIDVELSLWINPPNSTQAAVSWEFQNATNPPATINNSHGQVDLQYENDENNPIRRTISIYGDQNLCGHPAHFILKSLIYQFSYKIVINEIEIDGMNIGSGLDYTTAQVIEAPGNYCGNINEPLVCNTDHYFKVTLEGHQSMDIKALFTTKPRPKSTAVKLDLEDDENNLDTLLMVLWKVCLRQKLKLKIKMIPREPTTSSYTLMGRNT